MEFGREADATAFPSSWLDELMAKNDIVTVVSAYCDLKPKGRRLWACCPLHGEKTPSFSVSPDKQMFYCFGCHAGGTVIQFIMQMERLSYAEAIRFLADRAGMSMPEEVDDSRIRQQKQHRDRLYEACRLAARFYMETLLSADGEPARAYLARRGLGSEAVKRFGIGYAKDGWENLKRLLTEKGFTEQELLDAGLLVCREDTGRSYDAYRGRVIYPIVGVNGKVMGFGARTLGDDKPKYINTTDTPIYNKRRNLYGLNLQKGAKLTDLVIVEGYMDVIGLYEGGISNAVASLGTALTEQQAKLIKRYVDTVYIAYDGDAAGQSGMLRGLDILTEEGLSVRVIVFPDDLDPDEFVRREGGEAFERLKDAALSLNSFKLKSMADRYALNNENQREQYAKEACRFIASLQPIEQERYYRELSDRTGYPLDALIAQGGGSKPIERERAVRSVPGWKRYRRDAKLKETERIRAEMALVGAVLSDQRAAELAASLQADELLSVGAFRTLYTESFAAYLTGNEPNAAAIIAGMDEEDARAASAVLREDVAIGEPETVVRDCVKRIRKLELTAEAEEMTQSVGEPGISEEERARRLIHLMEIQRKIRDSL